MTFDRRALVLVLVLAVGCAGRVRPIRKDDVIGGGPAAETSVRVKERISIPAFGHVFELPPGDYHPTHVDGHGVFYASPTGITERRGERASQVTGGIHMPNEPGRYYSFPSLFVDLGDGTFSKYPLPDDVRRQYGRAFVFTRRGEEAVP